MKLYPQRILALYPLSDGRFFLIVFLFNLRPIHQDGNVKILNIHYNRPNNKNKTPIQVSNNKDALLQLVVLERHFFVLAVVDLDGVEPV